MSSDYSFPPPRLPSRSLLAFVNKRVGAAPDLKVHHRIRRAPGLAERNDRLLDAADVELDAIILTAEFRAQDAGRESVRGIPPGESGFASAAP